jgi:hypothetical protein
MVTSLLSFLQTFLQSEMTNDIKKLHIPTGLSLPIGLYEQIEKNRGDISRSKYIEQILSASLSKSKKKAGGDQ